MSYDVTCEVIRYQGVVGLVIPEEIIAGLRLDDDESIVGLEVTRHGDYVLYNARWLERVVEIKEQRRGNE